MIWIILALIILAALVYFNSESKMLTDLKVRYWAFLDVLRRTGDPRWAPVLKPSIITGMSGKYEGVIGSNVNKGYEIYICLDGDDVNTAMYVLIHELAHMSVAEYDHSGDFWQNFKEMKEIAVENGLYARQGSRGYCGDVVRD
jgi:hypothetical protein